jgi:hypothetical protein
LVDFVVLYAFLLPLLDAYLSMSEDAIVFLLFILEGLLIIAFAFYLARIILVYYYIVKSAGCFRGSTAKERHEKEEKFLRLVEEKFVKESNKLYKGKYKHFRRFIGQ